MVVRLKDCVVGCAGSGVEGGCVVGCNCVVGCADHWSNLVCGYSCVEGGSVPLRPQLVAATDTVEGHEE